MNTDKTEPRNQEKELLSYLRSSAFIRGSKRSFSALLRALVEHFLEHADNVGLVWVGPPLVVLALALGIGFAGCPVGQGHGEDQVVVGPGAPGAVLFVAGGGDLYLHGHELGQQGWGVLQVRGDGEGG